MVYLHFPEPERVLLDGSINRPVVYIELRTNYKYVDDHFCEPPCGSLDLSFFEIADYKNHTDKAETLYIRLDRLVMAHRGPDLFGLYVQFDRLEFLPCKRKSL